jgi:protein subunit release factor A
MIDRKDLRIDVYDSRDETSGASDWAVRVTHVPSGVTAYRSGAGSDPAERKAAVESAIGEIDAEVRG